VPYPFTRCKKDTPNVIKTPENNDFPLTTPQTKLRPQPLMITTLSTTLQSVLTPTTMPYLLHTTPPQMTTGLAPTMPCTLAHIHHQA
jgi:hypothetical protein